jgi:hypothetical protein
MLDQKTEGGRADVVFVDPPYNVAIDGNVCGKGTIRHREFKMAAGEMSEAEFVAFLVSALRLLALYSVTPSVHFVCMDWRHIKQLIAAGDRSYSDLLNVCVWVKNNGGMGSLYRSRHELVFVFRTGRGVHRNNVTLGQYGRNRTNVWEYAGVNTLSRQGDEGNLLALQARRDHNSDGEQSRLWDMRATRELHNWFDSLPIEQFTMGPPPELHVHFISAKK